MTCRVGVTTNPTKRKLFWMSKYPALRNWEELETDLTYDEAQAAEAFYAAFYGCKSKLGGERVDGSDYVVYRFDY